MQKVIVAFTSYPKRIRTVYRVVESIWKQKVRADEIILYLSIIEFPKRENDLPFELVEMVGKKGFQIEWTEENLKSHKKYYYALQSKGDNIVITIDDDILYSETLISDLMTSYKKYPMAVSARKTRIIVKNGIRLAEYSKWDSQLKEYADIPRMDLCAIGSGGVLYPPLCACSRWFDKQNIKNMVENQDDIWLKYNEAIDRISTVYVKPEQDDIVMDTAKENALCVHNLYGGGNDKIVNNLMEYMKEHNPEKYDCWFGELMQEKEYIQEKKGYYSEQLLKFFKQLDNSPVYLYGAGKKARLILKILEEFHLKNWIEAILVSDKSNNTAILNGIEVKQIDELNPISHCNIIYGVGQINREEINRRLKKYNCRCWDLDIGGITRYFEDYV